ncbi:MAG: hypothetical protein JWN85_2034 [Gammaproteobacteria bacterium]|jgi:hypothetical protein|nr:hypothetical protein [Gammaproteobacteria bacterium]
MKKTWRLWQPPAETLEAIADVLTSHWHAAKAPPQERLFWPGATNWLHQQAVSLSEDSVFGTRYLASLAKQR